MEMESKTALVRTFDFPAHAVHEYTNGDCAVLCYSLHKILDLPCYGLICNKGEPLHFFVGDNGFFIDIVGIQTKEEMIKWWETFFFEQSKYNINLDIEIVEISIETLIDFLDGKIDHEFFNSQEHLDIVNRITSFYPIFKETLDVLDSKNCY